MHHDDISTKLTPPSAVEREEFVEREGHRRERQTLHRLLPEPAPNIVRDKPAARGEADVKKKKGDYKERTRIEPLSKRVLLSIF